MKNFVKKLQIAREVQRFIETRAIDKNKALRKNQHYYLGEMDVENDSSASVAFVERTSHDCPECWQISLTRDELLMDDSQWVDHCHQLRKDVDAAKDKKEQARLQAIKETELQQLRRLQEKYRTDVQPIHDKLDSMIKAG